MLKTGDLCCSIYDVNNIAIVIDPPRKCVDLCPHCSDKRSVKLYSVVYGGARNYCLNAIKKIS